MISVEFACGHTCDLKGEEDVPACTVCGDTRVGRVTAPAPTFRGWARGPNAQFQPLAAEPVSFDVKR